MGPDALRDELLGADSCIADLQRGPVIEFRASFR